MCSRQLYKFAKAALFLPDGLFRFTQPASLNDPDESLPQVLIGEYAPEDYEVAYSESRSIFGGHLPTNADLEIGMAPWPSVRVDEVRFPGLWRGGVEYPTLRSEPFYTVAELDRCVAEKAVKLCWDFVNANIGILSLTKNYSEALWAYYGDDHNGIAVAFDFDHPFFSTACLVEYGVPVRVSSKYGKVRIAGMPFAREDIIDERIQNVPLALLLRKKEGWAHENEVRLIRPLNKSTKQAASLDCYGRKIYLFQIPNESVVGLTFGYRASDSAVENVVKVVSSDPRWQHLKLARREWTPSGVVEHTLIR